MLEDAYKSCPDVICIRAGISAQLSVVANVYFNGLLCNPRCADLSGLICTFSSMPAHCFWRYNFGPIAVELVTGGSKKCNTCRSPVGRCFGRAGCEAGGRWVGAGLTQRDVLGVYFTVAVCNKHKGGFIKHIWEPRKNPDRCFLDTGVNCLSRN